MQNKLFLKVSILLLLSQLMPFRLLIRTHHITSFKKLHTVRLAASQYNLSLFMKTGPKSPGLMLAEGTIETDVRA